MREVIYKHALKNALDYGRAEPKAVLGKVLAEMPELKEDLPRLMRDVEGVVKEVNSLSSNEVAERARSYVFERREERKGLPELPNPVNVVLRFAPNPSGPLHLGHCRAAILNDEYAGRYEGTLILRFEDTDPARVDPEAYDMIQEDLDWLGIKVHEVVYQSDRLDLYYEHAKKLLETGNAYVCTCPEDESRRLRKMKLTCKCRDNNPEENLERYADMFSKYRAGEAVVRLKTGVELRDPAMRDFVILRISEKPHPKAKGKRVFPLYNFSVAVDDHLMKISHVLRGKDHIINTKKQGFIYDYFRWEKPEFLHYGLLKIEGLELSTSLMAKGIAGGEYSGWDDVGLGTLRAMRRRGIQPQAIRKAMLDVGIKSTDISFSWKNLYAINKELIDARANRYFFVAEPRPMIVEHCPAKTVEAPLHPDSPRGTRKLRIESKDSRARFYISASDFKALKKGEFVRLMEACNVEVTEKDEVVKARFHSEDLMKARKRKAKLIHWVSEDNLKVKVVSQEGSVEGLGEKDLGKVGIGEIVQFERFGFARIDEVGEEIVAYFAHK